MEYVIEDKIPIPPVKRGAQPELYDTVRKLKINQSFLVPNKHTSNINARLAFVVSTIRRHEPMAKFITRKVKNGIRVWRVN